MTFNPVKAVKQAVHLFRIKSRAAAVLETAQKAEKDRALYRDSRWWSKVLSQGHALLQVLPVPQEIKDMAFLKSLLTNWKTTLGGLAAGASAVAIVANDPSRLTDPVVLGLFGAAWAGLHGKDANVTGGTKAATSEAATRVD